MGALTPVRTVLRTGRFRDPAHERRHVVTQVSLLNALDLPTIPSPTTPHRPRICLYLSRGWPSTTLINRCAGIDGILDFAIS